MSGGGSQEKGSLQSFRKSRSHIKEAPRMGFWAPAYLQGGWSSRLRKKHKWSEEAAEVSFRASVELDTFQNPGPQGMSEAAVSGLCLNSPLGGSMEQQQSRLASDPPCEVGQSCCLGCLLPWQDTEPVSSFAGFLFFAGVPPMHSLLSSH